MGRKDLIGYAKNQLIPTRQPAGWEPPDSQQKGPRTKKQPAAGSFRTQHTGLPPSSNPRAKKRGGARAR
jgi:hypothetical protein